MIHIHWFRRDLRLVDNRALNAALNSGKPVRCIFIFDTDILDKLTDREDARVHFIHRELCHIDSELRRLGSSLHVYHGRPIEIWQMLAASGEISEVFCNRDYEPYAMDRDKAVHELLESKGIKMTGRKDHVIFEKGDVLKDDGKPYTVYTPYSKKWKTKLLAEPSVLREETATGNFEKNLNGRIPTLEELRFHENKKINIPPREFPQEIVRQYHLQRDLPAIMGTSRLSVHLRFGTVSIRTLVQKAIENNEKWLNELIWRDFYHMILYHFPHSANASFKPAYDHIEWLNNEQQFQCWCEGNTGYPIVDAGMRELNATGFMHNRVRMITASFLTKHLLIDWKWGERYFASKLLDFDLASNVGGWQWAAGSGCDAAPYFRVFNPTLQTEKFDPHYRYIQKWIPEWKTHYCSPIVEHSFARNRAIAT
ncbi:MAG: cryptochrome/photolyase family protein, partial [Flavobacteriales bacterium]